MPEEDHFGMIETSGGAEVSPLGNWIESKESPIHESVIQFLDCGIVQNPSIIIKIASFYQFIKVLLICSTEDCF